METGREDAAGVNTCRFMFTVVQTELCDVSIECV